MYYKGVCDNKLISGAQGPGCLRDGCGIDCKCDPTSADTNPPAPDAPTSTLDDVPTVQTGHASYSDIVSATTELISTSGDPGRPISWVAMISSDSNNRFLGHWKCGAIQLPGTLLLITISGPLPEPTSFPLKPPAASSS